MWNYLTTFRLPYVIRTTCCPSENCDVCGEKVVYGRGLRGFGSRYQNFLQNNYNVTVVNVNVNKCEVKVKITMFAAGEPLTVTWIVNVSH